jgi:hypothetical protein
MSEPSHVDRRDRPQSSVRLGVAVLFTLGGTALGLLLGAGGGYVAGRSAGGAIAEIARADADRAEADAERANAEAYRAKADAAKARERLAVLSVRKAEERTGTPNEPDQRARKPISRDEFRAAVTGKTQDQVARAMGQPDDVLSSGGANGKPAALVWSYSRRTINPANMKTDKTASVTFRNGVASELSYD